MTIKKDTIQFLEELNNNNNRDWFNNHKEMYFSANENFIQFVQALIEEISMFDKSVAGLDAKSTVFRIYRDIRFSKDKSPYNPRLAGSLRRVKPMLRGGYYYWIKPGSSRIGCGFTYPNPDDLKRIRLDIERNYKDWNKLLKSKSIQSNKSTQTCQPVGKSPFSLS